MALQCPRQLSVQVRLSLYVAPTNAVASVAVDVAEVVVGSMTAVVTTTCEAIIRMEDEEVITTVGVVEAGTHQVVEGITGIKAGMEDSRTFPRHFRTHGHLHLAEQTSFPLLLLAGSRLCIREVTRVMEAMAALPYHHPHSVRRGWATHLRNMVDHRQDKPVTTAP
jgi:hypothetical protein